MSRAKANAERWFTAGELADLALPGMPDSKRAINRRAEAEGWALRLGADNRPLARKRAGRGGGIEYHASVLPAEAQLALARLGLIRPALAEARAEQSAWEWFERQGGSIKAEAERRLAILDEIGLLIEAGTARAAAVSHAAKAHQLSPATIWNWRRAVEALPRSDWLPALAPRRRGGGIAAEIDPELWRIFKSDFLRPSAPTVTSCYARTAEIAAQRGLAMPSERTFRRRLEREVPAEVVRLKREGAEALRRSIPAQRRSVAELCALEWVNIDGHKLDVFVRAADGRVIRPILVAIQDIYSRKILGWRIGGEESAIQTRLAFADVLRNFGIPGHCVLDNGRAFASKWITGGAKSRFRFKIRPEEPQGLLTALGIRIHWALPFRGQSKPIERGFRDLCEEIARHPACEGAYTGNNPLAKPENYGSRALDWEAFKALVAEGIARHNARGGRRTETARGRSFDEAFAESYARTPIAKATAEQLRLALLAAENRLINRQTGEIALFGNRYWHPELSARRGERVTVRFDPDDLHGEIHVYDLEGRYLTAAELIADSGFADVAGAKAAARRESEYRKRAKALAEAEALLAPEEIAALQRPRAAAPVPEAGAIRPLRHPAAPQGRQASRENADGAEVLPIDRMRLGLAKFAAGQS